MKLVLKNANIVNVFTEQMEQADVMISDGMIIGVGTYHGEHEVDLSGKYLCPGFMDGHMHFESSLITPNEYERAALPHGTTAVVADPHEIANVSGTDGIDLMLSFTEKMTMHAYIALPSCVPSCELEESGARLEAEDLKPYYRHQRVIGLAEVMDANRVVSGDKAMLQKIADAKDAGKNVDGHAPGLSGEALNAYVAAGVRTDHECTNATEALEKLRLGQWIMIREGTAAKNLEALLPLCEPPYDQRCLFVTDDRHPEDLLEDGHMDAILRKAIALGVPAIRAIKICTYNAARCFDLKGYGAVAPGYHADLVVLDDLDSVQVSQVYIDGTLAAKDGMMCAKEENLLEEAKLAYPGIWDSFHISKFTPETFHVNELKNKVRVLCLESHELLTHEAIEEITEEQRVANGVDLTRDIIKMAVLERHHNTGHVGMGFLRGYGLKKGAIATSVAHDAHNLIVVGIQEEDMYAAAKRAEELGGGLIVVEDGKVVAEMPLPIGGIMSELSVEEADQTMKVLKKSAQALGVSKDIDPFMTLGFASLPVIPKLRINGRGLIDVEKNEIVDITLE